MNTFKYLMVKILLFFYSLGENLSESLVLFIELTFSVKYFNYTRNL